MSQTCARSSRNLPGMRRMLYAAHTMGRPQEWATHVCGHDERRGMAGEGLGVECRLTSMRVRGRKTGDGR